MLSPAQTARRRCFRSLRHPPFLPAGAALTRRAPVLDQPPSAAAFGLPARSAPALQTAMPRFSACFRIGTYNLPALFPDQNIQTASTLCMLCRNDLDRSDLTCVFHMRSTAGAHIRTRNRNDADRPGQLFFYCGNPVLQGSPCPDTPPEFLYSPVPSGSPGLPPPESVLPSAVPEKSIVTQSFPIWKPIFE